MDSRGLVDDDLGEGGHALRAVEVSETQRSARQDKARQGRAEQRQAGQGKARQRVRGAWGASIGQSGRSLLNPRALALAAGMPWT